VKKIGAEAILVGMLLPWMIWVTIGLFASHEVEAVQNTQNSIIIEKLDDLKQDIKELKSGH
jgi:hypothetical protein